MRDLKVLNDLFFPAEKQNKTSGARVKGIPYINSEQFYTEQSNDFHFVTYKEVIVGGLRWTQKLFGDLDISNLRVLTLENGDAKEWFNVQIVQVDEGIQIDGEKFYPFVNIQYSYNEPEFILFDIGFNRFACSNKLIRPGRRLQSMKINSKDLYEIPSWINSCLLKKEIDAFQEQIKILKATLIDRGNLERYIRRIQRRWGFPSYLIEKYIHEMGTNAYALLNILTDAASNRFDDENLNRDFNERPRMSRLRERYQSEFVRRQFQIGWFLEMIINEIQNQNNISDLSGLVNSNEFALNSESFFRLNNRNNEINRNLTLDISQIRLSIFI